MGGEIHHIRRQISVIDQRLSELRRELALEQQFSTGPIIGGWAEVQEIKNEIDELTWERELLRQRLEECPTLALVKTSEDECYPL